VDTHILDNIPLNIDLAHMARALRIADRPGELDDLKVMIAEAESVGRPKAMYGVAPIEMRDDRSVLVNGVLLTSRILRVNLDGLHRVFPYAATCGTELEEWSNGMGDRLLHRFWADAIKEKALRIASEYLGEHLEEHYRPGPVSHMNPGSLADWPLKQQRALFEVLGSPQESIGVHLTESMLMVPVKSVSGIIFVTEETFASCQLCPMQHCPNRRAPYDREMYAQKYKVAVS
jgi:Vitamin B12 dependent methionine synthase, activation domain